MTNIVEGSFGKKPPAPKPEETKQKPSENEIKLSEVPKESQKAFFHLKYIGYYMVITDHVKTEDNTVIILRGRTGQDVGILENTLRRQTRDFTELQIGDLVIFSFIEGMGLIPAGVYRVDGVMTRKL